MILINIGMRTYSIKDYERLSKLILCEIAPSKLDMARYDFNRDKILNSSDYVILANILNRKGWLKWRLMLIR